MGEYLYKFELTLKGEKLYLAGVYAFPGDMVSWPGSFFIPVVNTMQCNTIQYKN